MSHNKIEIQEGAFIIGDAHYSHQRPELLEFIKAIESKKLQVPQLILMGDVFDALFGGISYTENENAEIVELLKSIANSIEVVFLEGNHDFNLQAVFSNIRIFKINQQPVLCSYKDKKVYLAHGDFNGAFGYKVYTALIRNRFLLFILNFVNNTSNNFILKKLDAYLGVKDDCKEFTGFKPYIEKHLDSSYTCDYFIEGHFHQNRTIQFERFTYINLAAFACNQRYFVVNSLQDKELLEEKTFSKGIR